MVADMLGCRCAWVFAIETMVQRTMERLNYDFVPSFLNLGWVAPRRRIDSIKFWVWRSRIAMGRQQSRMATVATPIEATLGGTILTPYG